MANYIWDGGGSDNNWNTVDNWDDGSGFPDDNNDRAIFNGTSTKDCTVNVTTTVGRLSMDAGYSGTITLGAALTMDDAGGHAGSFELSQGTLDTGSDHALTVDELTDVAGTLTCNASTVSLGSGVTSGYGLSVAAGGTFTGGSGTHTMGSLRGVGGSPGATITLSSGVTTIDSETSNQIMEISGGTNSWNNGGGTLTITTPAASNLVLNKSGATLNNFIINHASAVITIVTTAITVAGNMTITAGQLTTGADKDLTVTGTTTVGDGSAAADTSTLTCNASAISLGTSRQQADYALNIEVGGTFVGGTGTHTVGSLYMAQSANAKATMTTGVMTINGYNNSANKAWRVEYGGDTFDNANGTVKFAFNGFDTRMSMRSESHANNAFHNLIIAHLGDTRTLSIDNGTDVKVDNNLTVSRGILNVGSNHNLEVVGHVDVGTDSAVSNLKFSASSTKTATFKSLEIGANGTYEATSGTTTLKGEHTSGFAWFNEGTFTDNDGTVSIGDGSTSIATTHIKENRFHHLTINRDASNINTVWRASSGTTLTADGILTITKGFLYRNTVTHTLTVTEDVDIAANGSLGLTADTGPNNFGSLTIASGGAYYATSGTTTITADTSDDYWIKGASSGTTAIFTHNNGTVVLNNAGGYRLPTGIHFYNLTVKRTGYVYSTYMGNGATITGTTHSHNFRVDGTLIIENGTFTPYNADKVYIHNLIIGDGTGSSQTAVLGMNADDVFNGTMIVDNLTIKSDGLLRFGDGDETSATVGSSALNIYGAFRNLGGSIDIQ